MFNSEVSFALGMGEAVFNKVFTGTEVPWFLSRSPHCHTANKNEI
jgi:hypothetical protein